MRRQLDKPSHKLLTHSNFFLKFSAQELGRYFCQWSNSTDTLFHTPMMKVRTTGKLEISNQKFSDDLRWAVYVPGTKS